jgi:hypothetical protein
VNAFTLPKSVPWLKELNVNHSKKAGGKARAVASNGAAVPSLSNGKGLPKRTNRKEST